MHVITKRIAMMMDDRCCYPPLARPARFRKFTVLVKLRELYVLTSNEALFDSPEWRNLVCMIPLRLRSQRMDRVSGVWRSLCMRGRCYRAKA